MWVRRTRDQRGAVAVEAALITPFLCILLFGIIEMSLLMRDAVSVNSSVRTGARIASVSANAGPGTCVASTNPPPCTPATAPALAQAAADAIARAGSAMPKDSIEWVMIYDANVHGFPLPASNKTLTCTTNCVRYVWDKNLDKFRFGGGSWNTKTTVNACVNDPNRSAVGIAMRANHAWMTGFFGSGVALNERSVMQFEPLPNEQCLPNKHA